MWGGWTNYIKSLSEGRKKEELQKYLQEYGIVIF